MRLLRIETLTEAKIKEKDLPDWAQPKDQVEVYEAFKCMICGEIYEERVIACIDCGNTDQINFEPIEVFLNKTGQKIGGII